MPRRPKSKSFARSKFKVSIYPSPKLRVVTYCVDGRRVEVKGEWILTKTELLHIDPIQDLVELALWTNWVAREYPVSLLLYADFESGKTELQKKYYDNRGVSKRRRFSATGIKESLLNACMHGT